MDLKLNHSDLSALLAEATSLPQSKAELFTKTFFDVILEGLQKDGIVKINGLGTFKMVDVASRSSVNVNTGEKFEIKGHKKLSFVPADALKEKVNQPFAMFEPVEVSDDYVDEDVETTETVENTEATEIAVEETDTKNEEPETVARVTEEALPIDSDENEKAETAEPDTTTETTTVDNMVAENEPENVETIVATEPAKPLEKDEEKKVLPKSHRATKWILLLLPVVLLVGAGTYLYIYYNGTKETANTKSTAAKQMAVDVKKIETETVTLPQAVDSLPESSASTLPEDTVFVITEELSARSLSSITLKDTTMYRCVGDIATHRVGTNETLTKISLKYFNDKRLWPYIVKHNNMHDHNQLAIGMELAIPRLVPNR